MDQEIKDTIRVGHTACTCRATIHELVNSIPAILFLFDSIKQNTPGILNHVPTLAVGNRRRIYLS